MATYKPYKKTESGKEEIKIPYSVLSNPPDLSVYAKLAGGNTFSGNQVITGYLDIRGTAAEKHLKTRGIGGSDGNGNSSDLYLQYSSDYKTYFGKTGQSSLNADGSISINGKTVLTDASAFATAAQGTKADNAMPKSGGTFTGPVSSKSYYKSENADLRTSTTLSHTAVNVDNGRTNSHTAYMNGQINIKSASSSSEKTITIPDKAGTIALTSDIHDGTLTIQKNGETVGTFTANQSSPVTANITVPTKASDVNALSLDGGTINKSKTIKMDASANSDGANLKWGTVNSKNPYIGYASDQVDGTFVVGSLLGTNYASGLAIGGGSGNLLWKGTRVATTNDIPTNYVKYTAQTLTNAQKSQARSNIGAGTSNFSGNYNDLTNKPTPAIKSASLSGTTLYLTL